MAPPQGKDILLAGSETSEVTIVWAMTALMKNQTALKKVQAEVRDLVGKKDPDAWKNPEEFFPERFLVKDAVDFRGKDFQFIPFGAGRRGCPGINLGVATVELALANLLYAFDWELPTGMKKEDIDTDVLPGLTMHKKNALCLVAQNYQF
ncbi:unspecific monooxygenase [Sarracenia purpurea var. burkii]